MPETIKLNSIEFRGSVHVLLQGKLKYDIKMKTIQDCFIL